jgi:hypothetical protein
MTRSASKVVNGVARSVRGSIGPRVGAWADMDRSYDEAPSANYDALADLFLGDVAPSAQAAMSNPEDAEVPSPSIVHAPIVRGLVIGHLPVLASAWVRQYARHLAEESGKPCVLLRCRSDEAALEVLGSRVRAGSCETLREAMVTAHGVAGSWVVRVDDASEHLLGVSAGIDTLTVLTGADEAAIVGTYRSLKAIVPQSGSLEALPPVELVILGAPPDRAKACADRLLKTIETFLGRSVRVSAIIPKISATPNDNIVSLYAGPSEGVADALAMLCDELEAPVPEVTPDREEDQAFTVPQPLREPEPVVSRLGSASSTVAGRIDHAPREPAPSVRSAPMPGHSSESAARSSACPRLATFVAGLRPLGGLCPLAEDVEIALDVQGALHLLVSADEHASPHAVLGRLSIVAGWAMQHRKLLSVLAERESASLDQSVSPIMHVFSTDARAVRPLPDPAARLHLLVPITIASDTHWHCTALN